MSTVQAVMDRLFRTYLTPPDGQFAQVELARDVAVDSLEVALGDFTVPEDEELLRQGSILELDRELVRVRAYDASTKTATVVRGEYGTIPAAYTAGLTINLNPAFSNQSVFEAVRDNIVQLYPKLYTVKAEALGSVAGNVFPITNPLIVEVVQVWPNQGDQEVDIDAKTVEFHPQAAGPAVVTDAQLGSIWVRYRSRMAVAQSPDDSLEDLGVEEVWTAVVMAGAAADLMAGRDIPASQVEWVGHVLEAENIEVGTRSSLSVGLARYRELLIDRFAREMKGADSNRIKVHVRNPLSQVG